MTTSSKEPIHILLVEDNEAHVDLIRRAFEGEDNPATLTVASNIDQARIYLDEAVPDIAIIDLFLPDGKGLDLLPTETQAISFPIVIMTSSGDERIAVDAIKAGALDYVVKSEVAFSQMPHISRRAIREWNLMIEHQRVEKNLEFLATHDVLTKLPNRALFSDRIDHAIDLAKRENQNVAVFFMDLDGFKAVNDAFSHTKGDLLLQTVAARLRSILRTSDTISRMGGDEFSILVEGFKHQEHITTIARKILASIAEPFWLQDLEVYITASLGISVFPANGETSYTLLQNADSAMYHAKQEGSNNYRFYTEDMAGRAQERLDLLHQLKNALKSNNLHLNYQPQVEFSTGKITGVEALLRWNHPEKGAVSPAQFIPLAETTGMIIPVGEWVLETACIQAKDWQKKSSPSIRMAVNLSGRQLMHKDIQKTLEKILTETEMDPSLLELELTESSVLQFMDEAKTILNGIKEMGIHLAIDDFGTGYSSLSNLSELPFDTIKIDRFFTHRAPNNLSDAAIVSGMIAIARNLGMKIIIEGIETKEQYVFFQQQGCDEAQGWYFSKALPPNNIKQLLKDGILSPQ